MKEVIKIQRLKDSCNSINQLIVEASVIIIENKPPKVNFSFLETLHNIKSVLVEAKVSGKN